MGLSLADYAFRFGRYSPGSELSVPAVPGLEDKKKDELNKIVLLSLFQLCVSNVW